MHGPPSTQPPAQAPAERAWPGTRVIALLLALVVLSPWVRAQSPLLLMLVRGKVYLRMEHTQRSLPEIAQATQILLTAAQAALQNLPPAPMAGDAA